MNTFPSKDRVVQAVLHSIIGPSKHCSFLIMPNAATQTARSHVVDALETIRTELTKVADGRKMRIADREFVEYYEQTLASLKACVSKWLVTNHGESAEDLYGLFDLRCTLNNATRVTLEVAKEVYAMIQAEEPARTVVTRSLLVSLLLKSGAEFPIQLGDEVICHDRAAAYADNSELLLELEYRVGKGTEAAQLMPTGIDKFMVRNFARLPLHTKIAVLKAAADGSMEDHIKATLSRKRKRVPIAFPEEPQTVSQSAQVDIDCDPFGLAVVEDRVFAGVFEPLDRGDIQAAIDIANLTVAQTQAMDRLYSFFDECLA